MPLQGSVGHRVGRQQEWQMIRHQALRAAGHQRGKRMRTHQGMHRGHIGLGKVPGQVHGDPPYSCVWSRMRRACTGAR